MEPEKFVLKSTAIIGGIVTFATAVVPPLSKALGHEINPADIVTTAESLKTAIAAVGGLAGTMMVFWGRYRAKGPLTMSPGGGAK